MHAVDDSRCRCYALHRQQTHFARPPDRVQRLLPAYGLTITAVAVNHLNILTQESRPACLPPSPQVTLIVLVTLLISIHAPRLPVPVLRRPRQLSPSPTSSSSQTPPGPAGSVRHALGQGLMTTSVLVTLTHTMEAISDSLQRHRKAPGRGPAGRCRCFSGKSCPPSGDKAVWCAPAVWAATDFSKAC